MGSTRYDTVAIALHWSMACLIVIAFAVGLTVDDFPEGWEGAVVNFHALVGLAVLVLTVIRFGWRIGHPPPPLPQEMGPVMRRLAHATHGLLYLLMLVITLVGIPVLLYRGRGLDFGLFQIASPFSRTPSVFRPLTEIHELVAYALIALAVGHAAAALYHHFVQRDDVLRRMLASRPG